MPMRRNHIFAMAVAIGAAASAASGVELRGYWTLDDLTTGIENQGTDGATSDMTAQGPLTVTSGIIGSALVFNGTTTLLRAQTAGNAADDLTAYPFSLSVWVRKAPGDPDGDGHNFAIGMSQASHNARAYGAGIEQSTGRGAVVTRNTSFDSHPGGSDIVDGQWHHIAGVFNSTSSIQLFVDGKLVTTDTSAQTFSSNVDSLFIGGVIRSTTDLVSRFGGAIDDVGLFEDSLTAADVAVVNGLGQIAGFGLDLFDDAQTLVLANPGTTTFFGEQIWMRAEGLSGITGDFGGSIAGGDAFIVTSDSGSGLLFVGFVPEPSTGTLAAAGALVMVRRRRRKPR